MTNLVTDARLPMPAVLPGLLLVAVAGALALVAGSVVPTVSPLLLAILLGALLANAVSLPESVRPGLAFASRRLLRAGIVLLGLQVAVGDVLGLGAGLVATIVAVICSGFATAEVVGRRLGLAPDVRLLVGGGFSICGAAAVAAVDGVIDADDEDVATAVALVVLFGTLMIPLVPLVGGAIGLDEHHTGLWAGASVHEVAQVVAAAGVVGPGALAGAVVVKLGRVLMLAPVMACIGVVRRRRSPSGAQGDLPPLVPLFVLGFVAMVVLRSTGVVPAPVLSGAVTAEKVLLTTAMFALGTGVHAGLLRRVGTRPVALAAVTTLVVACVSLVGVVLSA